MTLDVLLGKITEAIVEPAVALLLVVALLVFLWGIFEYLRDLDSEEARAQGAQHMIWGVIGLTIMVSFMAIIRFIKSSLGIP